MEKNKAYANRGVNRHKKPLQNMVYSVRIKPEIEGGNKEEYEQYRFKDLGYLLLNWKYEKETQNCFHGYITVEKLKSLIGAKQYDKFCQGKREFIIQRRVNGGNI